MFWLWFICSGGVFQSSSDVIFLGDSGSVGAPGPAGEKGAKGSTGESLDFQAVTVADLT